MKICIDLEPAQEQQLNLFLQQNQLDLSEFVKSVLLDKLTQKTPVVDSPYELGKTLFGRFSSGDTERSIRRKQFISIREAKLHKQCIPK